MGLLVLFGTGLFGIVLSVGTYVVGNSDPASGRFLDPLAWIAKFTVPVVLVLLGLHATYDLVDLSTQILDKVAQNVESIPCRISFLFSSG